MKCIFCQEEKVLTLEHVLPNWLSTLYPKNTMFTNQFTGGTNKLWPSKIFQHKAKIVCAGCNNGWMSDLEAKTQPIIKSMVRLEKMVIDKNAQDTLAFWAQKTVLMLCQAIPGGLKITQDLYDEIYQKKNFSGKVLVNTGWRMNFSGKINEPIGSFEIRQIPQVDVKKDIYESIKKESKQGGFIWKAILAVGPIVFELIGHNMKAVLEIGSNTKVFKTIRPYNDDWYWPLEWPIEAEGGLSSIKSRG